MVHIDNGIWLSHKKWNLAICDNTDGSRGYYTKWSKSDKERQIPHDSTYMWNLKNKRNEQTKQKQAHRYREQTGGCQMGGLLVGHEKCEEIYTNCQLQHQSQGCKVQHRESIGNNIVITLYGIK